MAEEREFYEVWLVEGHKCFSKEVCMYAIFQTRKEARDWVSRNQEPHTHYSIRKSGVE